MSDRVHHHSSDRGLALRAPSLALRVAALGLLMFGWLVWVSDGRLEAQEKPAPTQPPRLPPPLPPAPRVTPQATEIPVGSQFTFVNQAAQMGRRFQFTIPEGTPVKDLLPAPPAVRAAGSGLGRTLAEVPEVQFQAAPARRLPSHDAHKESAHTIAKVNHLNAKKTDAFMEALLGARPDVAGLPFAMGDDCRTKGERSRHFTRAVASVRAALRPQGAVSGSIVFTSSTPPIPLPAPQAPPAPEPTPPATPTSPSVPSPPGVPAVGPPPTVPAQDAPAPTPFQPPVQVETGVQTLSFGSGQAVPTQRSTSDGFWERYAAACAQEDRQVSAVDRAQQEHMLLARVAALMQVLAPESPALRLGLVKYLAAVSHAEATRALARLAVFTEEEEVRQAAISALKVRRERDYTDILLMSLRYPWPAVAQRAADAIARLERTDLVPKLVAALDDPDPRAPVTKHAGGKRVHEVRELVRVNHHRNCLLCHAPVTSGGVSGDTLTAAVPVPSDPLPSTSDGYQVASPDESVRIDVTYLRQDFSMMQAVTDAHPWPEMQRFDFLVRTRTVPESDVATYRERLGADDPGRPSPYRKAIVAALRDLTGRDAAPTAEAWQRLLSLPAATLPKTPTE